LLDKLRSTEFSKNSRKIELNESLFENLKKQLAKVLISLNDHADIVNDALRHAIFEADNLIDEINTEALRRKLEADDRQTLNAASQVLNKISSPFNRFNKVINSKLQKLIEKLELLSSAGGNKGESSVSSLNTSSVESDESCIYGRDNDIKKLKMLLLSEDANDHAGDANLRMVSIIGMGGIGKTTLAKLLYNDGEVKEKFGVRGWAHVSNDFIVFRVLERILESIISQNILNDNLNSQLIARVDSSTW
jgi:nucleoside-triphosphatase THEP1